MSSDNTFGQNDWLVDEMFQQYQEDPNSVDAEWRKFFKAKGGPSSANNAKRGAGKANTASAPKTDAKVAATTGAPSQDGRETQVDSAAKKAKATSNKQTLSLIHI